jgi:hypothetical protein
MRNGRDVLDGYRLSLGSPDIDAGLLISDNGGQDFWGEPVPEGDTDVGASENLPTTPPDPATIVSPANGATDVSRTSDINWNAGAGTASHDVYFGTDPTPDAGEFVGNQAGATYDPGLLTSNTTYYWAIDEVNGIGTTVGPVWSFTTGTLITPIVTVSPATDITHFTATLHGEVTDTGGETPSVTLYYGDDDAGKVAGAWDHSVSMGIQASTFSTDIIDLTAETTYYCRAFADNPTGLDWSDVTSFATPTGQIALDAVSGKEDKTSALSWSHDLGGGNDRAVVVTVGTEGGDAFTGAKFNGVPMTLADGSTQKEGDNITAIFYMLDADLPSAGTYTVEVKMQSSNRIGGGAFSLENVKQEPPEAVTGITVGKDTYISQSITTLTGGAWIIDVAGSGHSTSLDPDSPQVRRYWYTPGSSTVAGSTREVTTAGTVTNSWTADDDHRMCLSMAAFAPN